MSLKHHGPAGYAEAIERDITLAEYLAGLVEQHPELQRLASGLSIVCFRYAPPPWRADDERLNALNKALLAALQQSGQAFLSGTTLEGTFALRAFLINPRTRAADLDQLGRRGARPGGAAGWRASVRSPDDWAEPQGKHSSSAMPPLPIAVDALCG